MINEELTITVCDDEGDEHEVTVQMVGYLTDQTRWEPAEYPEVQIPDGIPAELHEEIERVAMETFLDDYYRGIDAREEL